MRVKINRNVCPAQLAFCERCLGKFLKYPYGYERRCFEDIQEDGSDLLTIELRTGNHHIIVKLDEQQRLELAGEGWAKFMDFAVPMYRNEVRTYGRTSS